MEFVYNVCNISNNGLDEFIKNQSFDEITCKNKISDLYSEIKDTYEKYDNPEVQEDEKQDDNPEIPNEGDDVEEAEDEEELKEMKEEALKLSELIEEEKKVLEVENGKLKLEQDVLNVIKRYLKEGKDTWINFVKILFYCPNDTFNIITAVYYLLGKVLCK